MIKFFQSLDRFVIYNNIGKEYFYRYLPPNTKEIKVNIPHRGDYTIKTQGIASITQRPIRITPLINRIKLPPPERNRYKPFTIEHNERLAGESPAIIYTGEGRIYTGYKFKNLTQPIKEFVLCHEVGHYKYSTEKYCDLFAFKEAVKMGNNPSTCMYCLTDILKSSPGNDERIKYLFDKMIESEIVK